MGYLERGEKNVSFTTLVRLADALGITVYELPSEERSSGAKTVRKRKESQLTDIPGIIRALNRQREALDKTAGVLKHIEHALRGRERLTGKRHIR